MKTNNKIIGLLILTALIVLNISLPAADVLEIQGLTRLPAESQKAELLQPSFKSDVSQRNLLGLDRSAKMLLPNTGLAAAPTRTLKMCAIRVQFQYEVTDDDSTTGRGQYDMRTYQPFRDEERHGVDPAPHNREYFEKHIEALNNYWSTVSGGKVIIEGTVFPLQSDSVYTLDESMGYYGSQEPANGLGQFFYDALQLADQDDDINWAEYDVFVIFHAGSDRQNDIGFPITPYDLFTGFIVMGAPIPVENGSVLIGEGMIMPETASQDNRATALNAVIAHEFGHQLGLVDLYDSHTFTTFVGDFSLMDNNGFGTGVDLGFERTRAILGTIPLYPDAWSRAYLGFDDVVEIEKGTNLSVFAAELASGVNKIYKIPISENEYFLIENRQVDPDRDGGASLKADLDNTYVILGPAPNPDVIPPGQPAPLTREYDFLMPGSGMVIWHVDESVAWLDYDGDGVNNFYDNDLQWYYIPYLDSDLPRWENRPFLRLMEADGIIDFGGEYYTTYGRAEDLFDANRNNHFGPGTNPSSKSNSGAYSGINLSGITVSDTVMYFLLSQEIRAEGWPHHCDTSQFPPALYDVDGDGIDEIFVSGKTYLLGFKSDGDFVIDPMPGMEVVSQRQSTPRNPLNEIIYYDTLRVLARPGAAREITTPPSAADLNGDGIAEIIVGTNRGEIFIYELRDLNEDGRADQYAYNRISVEPITAALVIAEADPESDGFEIVAGSEDGSVHILSSTGETISNAIGYNNIVQFSISPDFECAYVLDYVDEAGQKNYFIHDLNDPGKLKSLPGDVVGFTSGYIDHTSDIWIAAVTTEGRLYVFAAGDDEFGDYYTGSPVELGHALTSRPILVPDFGGEGRSRLVMAGENQIYAYDLNGITLANFPQTVDLHDTTTTIAATPVLADINGDGQPEILTGTSAGEVFMINPDGSRFANSPLATPVNVSVSPAFCTQSEDFGNRGNLYALTDDGLIYSFILPSGGSSQAPSYLQADGGSHHHNFQEKILQASQPSDGLLTKYFNYPNPGREFTRIRFELSEDALANIRIYDLTGRLVYEDNMDAIGGMANEYNWELENYPSGVYYCRLEVKGSGKSDVQLWNIAVVK